MYGHLHVTFPKKGIIYRVKGTALFANTDSIYFYAEGIRYFRGATRFKHPSYIDRLVAHAYRKMGDTESEYEEWKRCLTVFTDDEYHIDIVKKHLKRAERKLKKTGGM